jgi:hypothetical protein
MRNLINVTLLLTATTAIWSIIQFSGFGQFLVDNIMGDETKFWIFIALFFTANVVMAAVTRRR